MCVWGGGGLKLEILKGGGRSSSFGNPGGREGGGSKNMPSIGGGGVDFFWNNPFNIFLFHLRYKRNGEQLNVSYWVTEALGTLNFILVCYTPISIKVAPVNHVS